MITTHRPQLITVDNPIYRNAIEWDHWQFEAKLDGDRVIYCKANNGRSICYNRHGEKYGHAQWEMDIPCSSQIEGEYYQGKFFVFDVLLWNGNAVWKQPLYVRQSYMNKYNYHFIPIIFTSPSQPDPLETAKNLNYEGVVIKNINDSYPFQGPGWYKVLV